MIRNRRVDYFHKTIVESHYCNSAPPLVELPNVFCLGLQLILEHLVQSNDQRIGNYE